jgi:hypothetical protein
MSNYLDDYVSVQDRLKEFINAYPDYRIKTHILAESLVNSCDVYIIKTELYRTEADLHPWTTGLSSESKSKQYALELAETGSLGRALNLAGYFAKINQSPKKAIETTKPALAEGKEYRGWVCPVPKSGHPAKWMRIGSDGHWVFQK